LTSASADWAAISPWTVSNSIPTVRARSA